MKYFGGCDVGSTYTKCVIIDENGKIVAHTTIRSKINAEISARDALEQTIAQVEELKDIADLAYLVGTGYGRNKVPQAQENISEISCHAMGVHVTNPDVKAIIDIGGQDVKSYTLPQLMSNISMVFQNVYLFADTIENNIKVGKPDATHEEVVEAAKKACCDEFIAALPDGYNNMIGEGGASLSGGEKQRISIARAMLKDAPIVIFDEATANVDPENEDRLQTAIEELTKDKTIIMIAHRLKTVRNADQILVVNGGHIVQQGKHDDLIKQKGIYADFVSGRKQAIGWKLGAEQ